MLYDGYARGPMRRGDREREVFYKTMVDLLRVGWGGGQSCLSSGVTTELIALGCDGIVMGCTEIPLILNPDDADVPMLDSTRLRAKAAVREALA